MRNSGVENKFYIVQGDIKDLYKTIKDLYKTAHYMQWLPTKRVYQNIKEMEEMTRLFSLCPGRRDADC
jgi:hypothetical protein